MTTDELHQLLESAEGELLEFKEAPVADTIARAVTAFLNTKGGRLILGVRGRGQVIGIPGAGSVMERIQREVPRLITPSAPWSVEKFTVTGKDILVIEVPTGADQPYVANGSVYFRRGEKISPATRDEMTKIILTRAKASLRWERQLAAGAGIEDLDRELILETIRLARKAERWTGNLSDVEGFLTSLGLSESGGITNAALLFYGKKPSRFFPQAGVRLLVLPAGKEGGRYVQDKWFDSNIAQLAKEIPQALSPFTAGVESTFSDESWQRQDRPRFPNQALREGVLNALIHRDYALTGSVLIKVQTKTVEIANPGKLPHRLTPADLKKDHLSMPRNPDLAHLSFLHALIEKVGRGTQKILAECRQNDLPDPKWVSSDISTSLTIYAPSSLAFSGELTERQQKILSAFVPGERIKGSVLARKVAPNVTDRTIRTDLLILIRNGLIISRGRGRSTSYQLVATAGPQH